MLQNFVDHTQNVIFQPQNQQVVEKIGGANGTLLDITSLESSECDPLINMIISKSRGFNFLLLIGWGGKHQ